MGNDCLWLRVYLLVPLGCVVFGPRLFIISVMPRQWYDWSSNQCWESGRGGRGEGVRPPRHSGGDWSRGIAVDWSGGGASGRRGNRHFHNQSGSRQLGKKEWRFAGRVDAAHAYQMLNMRTSTMFCNQTEESCHTAAAQQISTGLNLFPIQVRMMSEFDKARTFFYFKTSCERWMLLNAVNIHCSIVAVMPLCRYT